MRKNEKKRDICQVSLWTEEGGDARALKLVTRSEESEYGKEKTSHHPEKQKITAFSVPEGTSRGGTPRQPSRTAVTTCPRSTPRNPP